MSEILKVVERGPNKLIERLPTPNQMLKRKTTYI